MCEQPSFSMTSNDHFFDSLHVIFIISFTILRLLWVVDIWCHTMGFTNPDTFTAFHRWGLCLTIIDESFTLGGIYPNLLIPSAYCLLPFSYPMQLIWMLSLKSSPPNLTPNVVLINNRVPTTHHRIPKQCRSLPCSHTHVMRCSSAYAMQVCHCNFSCSMNDAHYMNHS